MKNNLFTYGTSELTHDAILCWIFSWGNNPEGKLYGLTRDMIKLLTKKQIKEEPISKLSNIKIYKQKENVDILLEIDDHSIIVIEDKVYSLQHGDQLMKYKESVESLYPKRRKYFNYITIGDEGNYNDIKRKGYNVVTRSDLLAILEKYKEDNCIVMEYYNYLNDIETETNKYLTLNISNWNTIHWQGFYSSLQRRGFDGKWGFVNPRSGKSFIAFYWNSSNHMYKENSPYEIYLQIEQDKITFRVSTELEFATEKRNYLWETLLSILPKDSIINRPKRFGYGKTMAFAVIDDYNSLESIEKAINEANKSKELLVETINSVK